MYHASILIRHANDNKLYLYDVIDIKKETSNPLGLKGLPDKKTHFLIHILKLKYVCVNRFLSIFCEENYDGKRIFI